MIVDGAIYSQGIRRGSFVPDGAAESGPPRRGFAWVGLRMPTSEELEQVCRTLGWHDVPCADIVTPHTRPVLTIDGSLVHLVLRTAHYHETDETVHLGELALIADEHAIVTVRFGHAAPLADLRLRLEQDADWLACGTSAVLASVVSTVVDSYRPALDGFEQDAVEVERDVFTDGRRRPIRRLYHLKRELRSLLLALRSLQDPLVRLARHASTRQPEEVVAVLQETIEQLDRIVTRAESLSNLLDAALDATLAQISVQQNDDMRRISAWVAMAAVPTLLAGIYGMNFETFPELRWRYGYPAVLLAMVTVSAALFRVFRRSDWL